MNVTWIGCSASNYTSGRGGKQVGKIVLHWMASRIAACDATFQDGRRQASAHYGIEDNEIHQYVKEQDTAWHCGNWDGNIESIGIEHSGGPELPISEETYKTSIELVTDLCKRYSIPADREHIRKHSEYKATQCPGALDVDRIVKEVKKNLESPPDQDSERALAVLFGYQKLQNLGNLEGTARLLVDRAGELKDAISSIETMKRDLSDREKHIVEQETVIKSMKNQMDQIFTGLGISEIEDALGKIAKLGEYKNDLDNARRKIESQEKEIMDLKKNGAIAKFHLLGLLIKIYREDVKS